MKNHGLIRYATLHCKKDDGKEVIMELDSSEETLAQYPFPFHYEIAYTLEDNKLTITYQIPTVAYIRNALWKNRRSYILTICL